jgi:hypothetical protein
VSLPPSRHPVQPPPIPGTPRPFTEYNKKDASFHDDSLVDIVAEGQIDPNYLVPAQTNAGDSLAPTTSTMNNDHIPLIPVPPLLTTHRELQSKLDELDEKIKALKVKKQNLRSNNNSTTNLETMTEDEMDQMIAQYLRMMADIKMTLNGVRTIYMSAATIPTVLQFQAHIIAYQVTLIEAAIFDAIPPNALLEHSSKNPHPRIVASTDFFNYITRCIEHSILLPQEASARAQLIHYWTKVASRCHDINNYQTLKAIISALNTPPVQRLKRTWAYIPRKSVTKLDALNELMSEANNYGNYREHMGMVTTSVGRSPQQTRDEHYARPTIPFLGTFIHDITYLLAAYKTSPGNYENPQDEPRIHDVLTSMRRFQTGPRYTSFLPAAFVKSSQKHHFRPALSNALHRGASRIHRISGGSIFGFDSNGGNSNVNSMNGSTSNLSNISERHSSDNSSTKDMPNSGDEEDSNLEEQQKLATQYVLMRPWVSQNTVDELSHLREPPQRANSINNNTASARLSGSSNHNRNSSVFSNASSNLRFSTGSMSLNTQSTITGDNSRPVSMEDDLQDDMLSSSLERTKTSGFWKFRRSTNDSRPVTIHEVQDSSCAPPVVPPRPFAPTSKPAHASQDQFKADLAERLAHVQQKS